MRRIEFVAGLSPGVPPTPVFFFKSAELHENKRVDFFGSAKKCKRVRKGLKRKGIVVSEEWVAKKEIPPKPPLHA